MKAVMCCTPSCQLHGRSPGLFCIGNNRMAPCQKREHLQSHLPVAHRALLSCSHTIPEGEGGGGACKLVQQTWLPEGYDIVEQTGYRMDGWSLTKRLHSNGCWTVGELLDLGLSETHPSVPFLTQNPGPLAGLGHSLTSIASCTG
jgi:hypothetical protein